MKTTALAWLIAVAAAPTFAQTVYRCGNAYSQVACAQGRALEIDDRRTADQQAEARRVASAERQLAEQLKRDRLADERDARPAAAASLGGDAPRVATLTEPARKKKAARTAKGALQPIEVLRIETAPRRRGA